MCIIIIGPTLTIAYLVHTPRLNAYVLNGLLIFHSEVDGSNLLPSPFLLGW